MRVARHALIVFLPLAAVAPLRASSAAAMGAADIATNGAIDPQEDELDAIDLLDLEVPPVVMAATRRPQEVRKAPYAISIITAEDIRRAGAQDLPDALRLAVGVDVADLAYAQSAVSPRGLHGWGARGVMVLVDGRQVFDPGAGGTYWGNWPFQMEDIARIEVIRGPAGVAWGANAVNGVINVVTKDPADQLGFTLTLGGGSRGSHKEHVGYAFRDDKLRLRVSGEYEASDGFRRGGSFLRSLDDDYKTSRADLHAVFSLTETDTFTLSAGNSLVDGGSIPTPLAGYGLPRNAYSQASFVVGNWQRRINSDESLELTAFVNDYRSSPGVRAIDYGYQQVGLLIGHTFVPRENHVVTWGFDGRADLVDGSNGDPHIFSKDRIGNGIVGLYAQDQWRFAPRWTLDLGGRIDYEFYGGFQPSARAALSYELDENALLYAAASRAFQMPPVGQRFLDFPLLNGLGAVTGNRSMDPDILLAYELGYRSRFFEKLDLGVVLYWHEFDDVVMLAPRLGPPGLINYGLGNHAAASMYGVELDAKYRATKQLTLLGNYTFEHLDWRSAYPLFDKELISPPAHKFMLGARYSVNDDLHLSGHLYYVDAVEAPNSTIPFVARRIAPYFRLDLRGEYEFWDDQASLAVGVRNLLDETHPEGGTFFMNSAEVPRMVYAEFRLAIRPL